MEKNQELIVHIPEEDGYGEKPGFDANLPADVRYDKNLSAMARLLYAEIRALSSKLGFCYAKNSYFERVFEIDERTVRRLIAELKENGYISTLKARNDVNNKIYRIIQIPGSKIDFCESSKIEPQKKRTKMSEKGGQKCPKKADRNVRQGIYNKYNNYNIYNARTRVTQTRAPVKQKNKFHNFPQRNYDHAFYEMLENALDQKTEQREKFLKDPFANYSSQRKTNYDELEEIMINQAYQARDGDSS